MTKRTFKFSNGDLVKEKVSGFTGVITGTVFYLTGCNQYLITSKSQNSNTEPQSLWYDEGRLDLVNSKEIKVEYLASEERGCDIAPPGGKRGS